MSVASGQADAGLGVRAAAQALDLEAGGSSWRVVETLERYSELVIARA
jgi:hypothetical protein